MARWFTKAVMKIGLDNEEYYGYDGILHSDEGHRIYIDVQAQADKAADILNAQEQRISDLEAENARLQADRDRLREAVKSSELARHILDDGVDVFIGGMYEATGARVPALDTALVESRKAAPNALDAKPADGNGGA